MSEIGKLTRVKPVTTSVDLGEGDSVAITFNANKITSAWMKAAEDRDAEKDVLSMAKALSEVILNWDVTDNGELFAHTPENIAVFSYPAQQGMMLRIIEAAVPSRAEGEVSGSPSSPTPSPPSPDSSSQPSVPPATHQNGREPSPSPTLSASPSPT